MPDFQELMHFPTGEMHFFLIHLIEIDGEMDSDLELEQQQPFNRQNEMWMNGFANRTVLVETDPFCSISLQTDAKTTQKMF